MWKCRSATVGDRDVKVASAELPADLEGATRERPGVPDSVAQQLGDHDPGVVDAVGGRAAPVEPGVQVSSYDGG